MDKRVSMVLTGQVLSWLGDAFQTVALPVAIVVSHANAGQMAASITASMVARIAFTLFGGVWADRVQPRLVMALADVVRGLGALALAVGFWANAWSSVLIVTCAFASAAAGSFFGPAYLAWRRAVIPASQRQRANGTLSSLRQAMLTIGAATGGAVIAFSGPGTGFAVNALTYAFSLVAVVLWARPVMVASHDGSERFVDQLAQGWRAVRSRTWLLAGIGAAGVYHIGNGAVLVLAPLLVARELGGAHAVGVVAAAEGLGGLGGALLGARVHLRRPLFTGWAPLALMPAWALSFSLFDSVWPVAALAALGYAGLLFYDVHWETALQHAIPGELQGRVHSWDVLISYVALPFGSMAAAPLAELFGARPVIAVAAVFLLAAAIVPLFLRSMRTFESPWATTHRAVPRLRDPHGANHAGRPALERTSPGSR